MGFATFVYNQLLVNPSLPATSFKNQTAIITGSNTGLGLEAARHIARLGAQKVILAVRDTESGQAARTEIKSSINRTREIEVWPLDLASTDSVLQCASKAKELQRIDTLVLNAAVATKVFRIADGYEHSIRVNTINQFLLAFLLLPKMRQTADEFLEIEMAPHITILTSQVHAWPEFPQWKDERGILVALSDESTAKMDERYPVTKVLNVLLTREFSSRIDGSGVVVNMVDPGFCHSRLSRENMGVEALVFNLFKRIFARTEEVGARTIVAAAVAGRSSHGQYMVNGVVADEALSDWVKGDGTMVQKRLWEELEDILNKVQDGVMHF